jgi:membrane-associated protein
MNVQDILAQVLSATGVFNIKVAAVLFLCCMIGEFGFSLPYLLESIWLLAGYQLGRGVLSPWDLALFWLTAQAGRQAGAVALFYVSRLGTTKLIKLYKKYLEPKLSGKTKLPGFVERRINDLSPFSVALGRLFGLRIPITFTLGVKKKLPQLMAGVLLSSIVWDAIYLILGRIVGATVAIKPLNMFFYSIAGLTVLYLTVLAFRFIKRLRTFSKKAG